MGSRLIYDYNLQKLIPYLSDPDAWYQHLLDSSDGYPECDSQGHNIMGSGRKYRELKEIEAHQKEMQPGSIVNLVTPVAHALEMAKSEIKRKQEEKYGIKGGECMIATIDWNTLRY